MNLQEIITTERRNTDKIYLHREGIFWKTYERSAFAFIHRISRYKASKRFIKYLDTEVASIGFPDASRNKILGDRPMLQETEEMLVMNTAPIDKEEYDTWKRALPLAALRPQHQPGGFSIVNAKIAASTQGRLYSGYTTPAANTANGNGTTPRITLIEPQTMPEPNAVQHTSNGLGTSPAGEAEDIPAEEVDVQTLRQNANILRDIRNFSIENATPLECLIFVSSLKKQLNGNIR